MNVLAMMACVKSSARTAMALAVGSLVMGSRSIAIYVAVKAPSLFQLNPPRRGGSER